MNEGTIYKRYAKALMLAAGDTELDILDQRINEIADVFMSSSRLFLKTIENPGVEAKERKALVKVVCKELNAPPVLENFIMVLLEKRRLGALEGISAAFTSLLDEQRGRARATLFSAEEISQEAKEQLVIALEKRMGKKIIADTQVDKSLIGGISAQIGGFVFDASLKANLKSLKKDLVG